MVRRQDLVTDIGRSLFRLHSRQEVLHPPAHHEEPEGFLRPVHAVHRLGDVPVLVGTPVGLGNRPDRLPHRRIQIGADHEPDPPLLAEVQDGGLVRRAVRPEPAKADPGRQSPEADCQKRDMARSRGDVPFPEFFVHHHPGQFRDVSHQGHVPLLPLVGPPGLGLFRHDLARIDVERHLPAVSIGLKITPFIGFEKYPPSGV